MLSRLRPGGLGLALAIAPVVAFNTAGSQTNCAPATRASMVAASNDVSGVMNRRISLHGRRTIALREALDRLSAAARIRLSYTAELLELSRPVCAEYDGVTVGQILSDLIDGAPLQPVVIGDQVVLAPIREKMSAPVVTSPVMMRQVGLLDRIVVTGSTVGISQRSLPIALDVVGGQQLADRSAGSMSSAIDGVVPGIWLWEQSPLSVLARYGSIRGASSFGVSYPKVYVDGIEVANSLLVTHLDPDAISRIEVIRGPQGAALYGADAISGVMNIVTRQDGTEGGAPKLQLRTEGGATSSDYGTGSVLTQSHALSLRAGTGVQSGRMGMTFTTIGAFIPNAFSQQMTANGGIRLVGSRSVLSGTFRFFGQDARTPSSPVLAGLNLWSPPVLGQNGAADRRALAPYNAQDPATQRRLDSLSRLVISDSTDRQSVRQYTVGATGTFTQNDRWTHTAVAGVDGYQLKSATVLDGAFPTAIDSALRAATGNAVRTTFRASSVGQFGNVERTAATVTVAAEHSFVRDETTTQSPFAPRIQGLPGAPESLLEMRTNAGLIGQVSASFKESLFLSAGLRVERNTNLDGQSGVATLPMLGAATVRTYGPATLKLRAAYGKGIRPPQTSSRAGTLMGLRSAASGPALEPEQQSGVEAGADLFLGRYIALHATRFDQLATGLIQAVSVAQPASDAEPHYRHLAYELQNVGQVSNRGWELQGSFGDGPWSLGATFSQVDSRVRSLSARYTGDLRTDDPMLEVPSTTFGINASYVQSRWSSSWSVSRASNWINYDRVALLTAFANQSDAQKPLVGSDLRSFWRTYHGVTRVSGKAGLFLGRGMTFTLSGENLLGEQRGEPDNVTVLPGRTLSAGLKVQF